MAIQFQCPSCAAAIRVPDSAAGKKGTCPKCGTKLLVPQIEIPAASRETAAGAPSPPAVRPQDGSKKVSGTLDPAIQGKVPDTFFEPQEKTAPPGAAAAKANEPQVSPADPDGAAFVPEPEAAIEPPAGFIPPLADVPQTSIARKLRRRRRGARAGLWIPLVFGTAMVGIGLWFFVQAQPRLEGELAAEPLPGLKPPVARIQRDAIGLPDEILDAVLEDMQGRPLSLLARDWLEVSVAADERGIEIELRASPRTQFFRVDARSDADLRAWVSRHAADLRHPWREAHEAAVRRFVRDWHRQMEEGLPLDPGNYVQALGVDSLVGPLGYHVQAVAGGRPWRCVHEDDEGRLYFLLPSGTAQFQVEGRRLPDGSRPFRGRYRAAVRGSEGRAGGSAEAG